MTPQNRSLLRCCGGLIVLGLLATACTFPEDPALSEGDRPAPPRSTAAGSTGPDPCSWVTPDEVREATLSGVERGRTEPSLFYILDSRGIPATACDFPLLDGDGRVRIRVGTERAEEVFTYARETSERIADDAVWQPTGLTLWMLLGDLIVTIELPFPPERDPLDAARDLARKVRERS